MRVDCEWEKELMIAPQPLRLRAVVAVMAACLVIAAGSSGLAEVADTPTRAPTNPAFLRHLDQSAVTRLWFVSPEGQATGLIPSPVDLSHARGKRVPREGVFTLALPSSYDLRTAAPAKLTTVRNQGSCGSCWAFASYGSMESCLLPAETTDWSENNMKNTHGFDWTCCEGGNHYMSTAYLARWSGPITESSDPYHTGSCASPSGLMPARHVQNVDFIPDRAGSLDNDNIKQAVLDHGAVYTTLFMTEASPYFNSTTKALCYTGSAAANHAVCIVGWDNNYDKSNFLNGPAGNGAFIVKNSWGPGWGLGGYFYISYYDTRVGRDNAVFDNADATTNYDQVYDYDPLGWTSDLGYGSTTAWCANVFTATSGGNLRAVSFYTASPSSTYEVYIHLDPDSGPICPSGYVASKAGTIAAMGYHTVELDSPVTLTSGHKFSVVLKLTTPDYNYPIAYEEPYYDYSSAATASPGQSYVSSDGVSWTDLTAWHPNSNVCVKAFTQEPPGLLVSPGTDLTAEGPVGGPFSSTSQIYTLVNTSTEALQWSVTCPESWVGLSANGGTLQPGANTTLTVSVNSEAGLLGSGSYTAEVSFADLTSGNTTAIRWVSLNVYDVYEVRSTSFGWIDPASHAALQLVDDGVSAAQPIPFEFKYYGHTYTQLYVAANGLAGFDSDGLGAYQNADIPSPNAPNAVLCPYWDDLDPETTGSIRIGAVGEEPNRKLVISWLDVPVWASAAVTVSFQMVLCEGSHDIIFQYLDVKPGDRTFGAGRSATVGIENGRGTSGAKYSYNGSTLLANRTALLFTSRGPEIASAKLSGDGSAVSLRRAVVTLALGDLFYLESDDRSSGIRVAMPDHGVPRWSRADVTGVLVTSADGERCINAGSVSQSGAGLIAPVGMSGPALGGGDSHYDPVSGAGQQGVSAWRWGRDHDGTVSWTLLDIPGANNVGLLVRASGRVTWSGTDTFYVDDGSMLRDNSGHMGVQVQAPGLLVPPEGAFVCVTGVSSCFRADGDVYRRIIVCDQPDIEFLSQ